MFDRLRADQKMATPMSGSQAKAVRRATVEREHVDVGSGPSSVRDVLRMSGRPLDPVVRETFGSLFGHDFSGVRVHSDETAASAAADVGAKAFTQGQHIVLGGGSSAVHAGGDLLAHELTHVVQQHTAPTPGRTVLQREPEDDDRLEQRAREKAATLRRTQERATAGKELGQLTSREAEAELRDLENSYRRAGATSRSVTRKAMDLERYRKLLSRTGLTTLEKSQRQGAFDELQRTPRTTATPPQSKYVAGGPQLPDQELRPGRETYAQPDYSLYRRRPDGTLERIHVNLKSDDLHALSAAQSRARARAYVAQAVRNSQHLGEGESIEISFAQTP